MGRFAGVLSLLKARGGKLVWTAHNLHNHEHRLPTADRLIHRLVASKADAVIVHTESAKRILAETYPIRPDRISVIPHGNYIGVYPPPGRSREAVRRELGLEGDARLYVHLGNIRPYKNTELLIDAFQAARLSDGARLVLAGRIKGPELARSLEARIRSASRVTLDDRFVPDEELTERVEAADFIVLPYASILTSGTAVLAMSLGKPVIAPALGGLTDLLPHQPELLYPPEDGRTGLIETLQRAQMLRPDRLQQIGAESLARARTWDWRTVAERTLRVYRRVLGGGEADG